MFKKSFYFILFFSGLLFNVYAQMSGTSFVYAGKNNSDNAIEGDFDFYVNPLTAGAMLLKDSKLIEAWVGNHSIKGLNIGRYTLECSAFGYETKEQTVEIVEGKTRAVSLVLKKRNDGPLTGEMRDIDGNVYKTVKIGNQWWMAENLRVTHYRNGDPVKNVQDADEWNDTDEGAYCRYDNDNEKIAKYGLLYNWYTVNDDRNIAPAGWHVPTDEDWKQLEKFLGVNAGGKLKEAGTADWEDPNKDAVNSSGFTALPAGRRVAHISEPSEFSEFGESAYFWSSSKMSDNSVWIRGLYYSNGNLGRYSDYKLHGYGIRLVKD